MIGLCIKSKSIMFYTHTGIRYIKLNSKIY